MQFEIQILKLNYVRQNNSQTISSSDSYVRLINAIWNLNSKVKLHKTQ